MKGQRSKVKGLVVMVACMVALAISCTAAHGAEVVVGGYDVAKIAVATVDVLKEKNIISGTVEAEFRGLISGWPSEPLAFGRSFTDLYSQLGKALVEKKVATQKDIDDSRAAAEKSGGVKIGGVNPVVLAASYLDILVRKNVTTLPAAQSILDSAKSQ